MLNKLTAQILGFILLFPAPIFAQEVEEEEPMYTHIDLGEMAPFAGTLFNPAATAELITRNQYFFTDCDLRVEYEVAKARSEMQLQLDTLGISYNAQNERMNLLFEIKEQEIDLYREMALEQPNRNNHWWLAGGVVVGIGLSLGTFYAATNISQ